MYDELVKELRGAEKRAEEIRTNPYRFVPYYGKAADAIEELLQETQQLPRWIPVTERLPELKQKVLVATYHGGVYYGFMELRGKFYTANNTLADSWCWEPDVTHWMPLPEPPKEEKT